MSDAYIQLLEAMIQQLEDLKSTGSRFVSLSPEALAVLRADSSAAVKAAPPTPVRPQSAPAKIGSTISPPVAVAKPAEAPPAPSTTRKNVTIIGPTPTEATLTERATPTTPVTVPTEGGKAAALFALRKTASICTKCAHLASTRKNVVFGVGNPEAELMFVGEAPGADEDLQGEPFVGRAGELLTKIIEAMGLSRDQVYIANILKCRPDMPSGAAGNRKPTPEEMKTCIPFLHEQIDIIKPKLLVGLGGTALEGLLGGPVYITKLRGKWQTFREIPLMPTFHPSYVLRNQDAATKRQVWEDMLQVMEKLGMPVSEKQRGFFKPKG